ncbi:TerB family tellurite resistance protein [Flagellimonas sp. S3867]|uniref:tellurite resistance TerB family protein n=1 Tax=Flagellimonas sp. S3867 TaxID=2768063 RepID=UPI0016858004|nr:TerB family tellurite resistance protein [Flagellimonas sp. S3867]
MLNSEKIGNEFYQNLGKLYYAMAMTDGIVRPSEVRRLRKYVRQHWLDIDGMEDEFGTDSAFQIEIVFDWLQNEEKEGNEYFSDFAEFYKDQPKKFGPKVRKLIIETADSIASSFAGKNKSEIEFLQQLKDLLGN